MQFPTHSRSLFALHFLGKSTSFSSLQFIDTSVSCIGQIIWIRELHLGLSRIPNDPFDIRFGKHITRTSPDIWDDTRQAFIHDANPVPIHSHNDEWRRIPLFEALASGCISVEVDVHLAKGDLLVGHSSQSLDKADTLRSMYLEPLQRMLERQNLGTQDDSWSGIFNRDPKQTVVLLVDHKSSGPETFAELHRQLEALRHLDYLTYWNGKEKAMRPLTIVATGNAPFESVTALAEDHRDIFWDAHLERLPSTLDDFSVSPPVFKYNQSNSHYASTKWRNAVLWNPRNESHPGLATPQGKDILGSHIEQAAARGLLTRYWDAPTEPPNLQDIVWRVLVDAKVGLINMDDMGAVRDRARGWGRVEKP